ncbi:MAG: ATP-binding cassette domain-containing protein [Anaerolineales bacterium]|nr:ATP-binding cassette domain-containing protein [Anaerolineales bacterium]MCB0005784.1 ATP-binding cassette domain-containing protein [Anaerolineales bacterium]MCB0017187.1 ATP-binding cassette domain-containing protein [Anaerolineales bacterium]MCB8962796.1 ATP-binding cassette domain-containing protein [Ardenticatenales bacterium]
MVVAQDLRKSFETTEAVRGLSFSVLESEIFSLLGPNGAGKTTTISMLSCLLPPTAGDARLGGHSVSSAANEVKKIIGVVPQEIALYQSLNAEQNLRFWGSMYGMSGGDLKARIAEVLAQVGLSDRAKERVENYSGGMKRRLNIAAGLLHRPKILFMDEPTVGIDPQSRRNILDMVKALRGEGMTVIYTTHYMEEAEELSDRVGIIDHGQLIAVGTQSELTQLVGSQVTVRCAVGEGEATAEAAAAMAALPAVTQAVAQDNELVLTVPDTAATLPAIMREIGQLSLNLRSVEIEEPNLEAVFLHLTGHALRD